MKHTLRAVVIAFLLTASITQAKEKVTVKGSCEDAITAAEVKAAQRKWSSERPDPKSPVLSVQTSANFAKQVLVGSLFSHAKVGTLTFAQDGPVCHVESNGKPADVIAKELAEAPPESKSEPKK